MTRSYVLATIAGVLLGVAYLSSPAAVLFAPIAVAITLWAGRGLTGRERGAVIGLVGLSLAVRVLTVAIFFLSIDHHRNFYGILIGDEKLIQWRSLWMRNVALGIPISPEAWSTSFQAYGETGLTYVFGYLHALLGPSPYGVHLVNIALFMSAVVLLYRTVRHSYGPLPAFGGLLLVVTLPSLFAWSISALKEPAYFCATAVALSSTMVAVRGRSWPMRILAVVTGLLAINAVSTIRSIGRVITVGGIAVGVAARLATVRAWLALACAGLGVVLLVFALQRPDVQQRLIGQFRIAAVTHIGNVMTTGYAYHLLDPYYYSRWAIQNDLSFMTIEEAARYAVRAVVSVPLVPLPWQLSSRPALAFMPEQVLWQLSVLLALVGFASGLRRDPWLTWLLTGYCLVAAAIIALPSGNIGTFIRMRDMFVPFVFWLSALGGCVVIQHAIQWNKNAPAR